MDKTTGEYDFTRLETVVFGVGKVDALGSELSRRGAERALIVTGKTLGRSKLLEKVKSAAGSALAGVFTGAAQHVPSQTVTELVAEARRSIPELSRNPCDDRERLFGVCEFATHLFG